MVEIDMEPVRRLSAGRVIVWILVWLVCTVVGVGLLMAAGLWALLWVMNHELEKDPPEYRRVYGASSLGEPEGSAAAVAAMSVFTGHGVGLRRAGDAVMANRRLDPDELLRANALLDRVRLELEALSDGDADLLFAYRRKVSKELGYDERSSPMVRRKLKASKRRDQNGLCPVCSSVLPERYAVLDRFEAAKGYTAENTRLICEPCDREVQRVRGFS